MKMPKIEMILNRAVEDLTLLIAEGDALDGDQTEELVKLFQLQLDQHNGNLSAAEITARLKEINSNILER